LLLYSADTARWLPLLWKACSQGEFSGFATASAQVFRPIEALIARGAHFSVVCTEDLPFITPADVARDMEGTWYGPGRLTVYQRVAQDWPRGTAAPGFASPVKSDVPVLMFSGEADPVTPSWLATGALGSLSHGRQVMVPHAGHTWVSPVVDALAAAFVASGSAEGLDETAIQKIVRPPFVTEEMLRGMQAASAGGKADGAPRAAGETVWHGTLDVGTSRLRLVLHVQPASGGGQTATLDSPDQGVNGIPVGSIRSSETALHFELPLIGAVYEGRASDGGFDGEWSQGGRTFPLRLEPETASDH
jgi:hypothetical protein